MESSSPEPFSDTASNATALLPLAAKAPGPLQVPQPCAPYRRIADLRASDPLMCILSFVQQRLPFCQCKHVCTAFRFHNASLPGTGQYLHSPPCPETTLQAIALQPAQKSSHTRAGFARAKHFSARFGLRTLIKRFNQPRCPALARQGLRRARRPH